MFLFLCAYMDASAVVEQLTTLGFSQIRRTEEHKNITGVPNRCNDSV